jgi:nucleoside-diphosphate-sugar epimerase
MMQSMPRSLLVTGAGGFISRHIVEYLRKQNPGTQIVALDRSGRENQDADYCVSCDLIQENQSRIAEIIRQYDVEAVVHCAGSAGPDRESLRRDNLLTTTLLIETIFQTKPGVPFCHLGSAAEYKPLEKPQKTSEDTPKEPVGEYGRVKLQTTEVVLRAASRGDVGGYVLRLFNPIGTGMPETNLVGRVCDFLRNGQEACLRVGSLDSYRDYIDVRDVARAVVASLQQAESIVGQVINIGSGSAQSTRDLVNGLLSFCSRPVSVEETSSGSLRSESVYWQEADISRAERLLSWQPNIMFEQTIEHIALNSMRG